MRVEQLKLELTEFFMSIDDWNTIRNTTQFNGMEHCNIGRLLDCCESLIKLVLDPNYRPLPKEWRDPTEQKISEQQRTTWYPSSASCDCCEGTHPLL